MNCKNVNSLKELDRLKKNLLTTLKPIEGKETALLPIEVENDYFVLMATVKSIISVCQNAVEGLEEYNIRHATGCDISNTLEFAKKMLPLPEAEFLDNIR
ncbi:MAG: hypothetical protein OIF50_04970 [Flavobacteriaceae bacterium]|nr:hypothetical protein [Flavobacteriaceae bacterium]